MAANRESAPTIRARGVELVLANQPGGRNPCCHRFAHTVDLWPRYRPEVDIYAVATRPRPIDDAGSS
jgi:hypothetical protein